jgi:hypothetical protein
MWALHNNRRTKKARATLRQCMETPPLCAQWLKAWQNRVKHSDASTKLECAPTTNRAPQQMHSHQ